MTYRRKFLQLLASLPWLSTSLPVKAATAGRDYLKELGVQPIINAAGMETIFTGTLMLPEVVAAIEAMSHQFVRINELHDAIGKRIATLLGCEAAMVTSGAAAALTTGTAACLTGTNRELIRRLPDTTGMKNEVIVQKSHRFSYDHAVRNCGVRLIEVETADELRRAVNGRTAMMLFLNKYDHLGKIKREEFVTLGKEFRIPTFNDAAADLPPVGNLTKYLKLGFDLVAFSGGKALRGPQSSGLLLGRKDLIAAARLNGPPNGDAIGRPMKVNKEEMVGLLVALEAYLKRDHQKDWQEWERNIRVIAAAVKAVKGVTAERFLPPIANEVPHLLIRWDQQIVKVTAAVITQRLRAGRPSIELVPDPDEAETLEVSSWTLQAGEAELSRAGCARFLSKLERSCVVQWSKSIIALFVLTCIGLPVQAQPTAPSYDLLIKGGHVIDPKNQLDAVLDVAITGGKISEVAANIPAARARQTINAAGLYVTPGLVDIHVHVFFGLDADAYIGNGYYSVMPDGFTFRSGVTTVVDAGSSGWKNFPLFKKQIIDHSQTRVLAWLNIYCDGIRGGPYAPGIAFAPAPYPYRSALGDDPEAVGQQCAEALRDVIRYSTAGDVAAFIAEPVWGEGGIIVPPPNYFKAVKEVLDEHGILFITDEVQTGFARTGKMFAIEYYGVEPDILVTAKGIASGFPLAAFTTRDEIAAAFKPGEHLSTFGGNPVSCAAALANIEFIEQNQLCEQTLQKGEYLMQQLRTLQRRFPLIGEVRGLGLMIGVELVKDAAKTPAAAEAEKIKADCLDNGVLIGIGGVQGNVLRIQPPLVITREQLDVALNVIERSLSSLEQL